MLAISGGIRSGFVLELVHHATIERADGETGEPTPGPKRDGPLDHEAERSAGTSLPGARQPVAAGCLRIQA